jgi:hypothetical protein
MYYPINGSQEQYIDYINYRAFNTIALPRCSTTYVLCLTLLCKAYKAIHTTYTLYCYCENYHGILAIYVAVAHDNTHTQVGGAERLGGGVPECGI